MRASFGTSGLAALWLAAIPLIPGPLSATPAQQDSAPALPRVTGGVVKCENGKAAAFACQQIDLVSFLPAESIGATQTRRTGGTDFFLNDIWGWTDSATGREFALVGRVDGTSFVEVTDPVNPVYLGDLPQHDGARPGVPRDIKVYKNHAFVVADGAGPHGMQVFDLAQLLDVKAPPARFTETAHYANVASVHNLAIDEATGYAYLMGAGGGGETCGAALHIVDIRNPRTPTFVNCYVGSPDKPRNYVHDTQCTIYQGPDQAHRGKELCINSSPGARGMMIVDVSDKQNPKTISIAEYPNKGYPHQGWLSEDHRYFFFSDEGDERRGTNTRTIVFDLNDLEDPIVAKEFFGPTGATDHNLYINGRYMYQSNYKAGLRVVDVSDPVNPKEVGYFDTTPHMANTAGYGGAWSSYPYFKSGVVAVSSSHEGLFMLRFHPPAGQ